MIFHFHMSALQTSLVMALEQIQQADTDILLSLLAKNSLITSRIAPTHMSECIQIFAQHMASPSYIYYISSFCRWLRQSTCIDKKLINDILTNAQLLTTVAQSPSDEFWVEKQTQTSFDLDSHHLSEYEFKELNRRANERVELENAVIALIQEQLKHKQKQSQHVDRQIQADALQHVPDETNPLKSSTLNGEGKTVLQIVQQLINQIKTGETVVLANQELKQQLIDKEFEQKATAIAAQKASLSATNEYVNNICKLQVTIQQLKQENQQLCKQLGVLDSLKDQNEQLQSQNKSYEAKFDNLTHDIHNFELENASLREQVSRANVVNSSAADNQAKLDNRDAIIFAAAARNAQLQKMLEDKMEQFDIEKQQLRDQCNIVVADNSLEIHELKNDIQLLNGQIEGLLSQKQIYRQEIFGLNKNQTTVQNQLQSTLKDNKTMQEKLIQQQADAEEASLLYNSTKQQQIEYLSIIKAQTDQIASQQSDLEKMQTSNSKMKHMFEKCSKITYQFQTDFQNLKQNVQNDLKQQNNDFSNKLHIVSQSLQNFQDSKNAQIKNLQKSISDRKDHQSKRITDLENQLPGQSNQQQNSIKTDQMTNLLKTNEELSKLLETERSRANQAVQRLLEEQQRQLERERLIQEWNGGFE